MVDDGAGDVQEVMEQDVGAKAGAKDGAFPTASFLVAIGEETAPALRDPNAEWFVQAKHPRADEAKIRRASVSTKVMGVRTDGDEDEEEAQTRDVDVDADPTASFLAKCQYQISDYALPARNVNTGEETLRKFNAKGMPRGDNKDNREVYEGIVYARDQSFRKFLEAYLDWVAGRPGKARYDFEALLGVPGQ